MLKRKLIPILLFLLLLFPSNAFGATIPTTVQWGTEAYGWKVGVDQNNGDIYIYAVTTQSAQGYFNLFRTSTSKYIWGGQNSVGVPAGWYTKVSGLSVLGDSVYYSGGNSGIGTSNHTYSPVYTGPVPPSQPSGLNIASSTANSVNLAWNSNPSTDNVTSYKIYDNNTFLGSTTVNNYSATSLSVGVHSFQISATNTFGEGSLSSSVTYNVLPEAPNVSATNITTNSVAITWNNVSGATSFNIYSNGSYLTNTSGTSYNFSNLLDNTNYTIDVTALSSTGESNKGTVTFKTIALPSPPAGLSATNITTNSADLSWYAVSGAVTYILDQNDNVLATTSNTYYQATGLTPNTTYTYKVAVETTDGTSTFSNPITVTTLGIPPQSPTGLSAGSLTDTSFTLYWLKQNDATSYNVYSNGTLVGNISQPLLFNPSMSFTNLKPSSTYTFTIVANNPWGQSTPSSPLNVTTLSLVSAPNKVTGLKLTSPASISDASIGWDSLSTAEGYQYMTSTDSNVITIPSNSVLIAGLKPSTQYTIYVRSYNSVGFSDWSTLSFSTPAPKADLNMNAKSVMETASPVIKPVGGLLAFIVGIKVVAIIISHFAL